MLPNDQERGKMGKKMEKMKKEEDRESHGCVGFGRWREKEEDELGDGER